MIAKEHGIISVVLLSAYWIEGKDDEPNYRIKSLAYKTMLRPGTLAYRRVRSDAGRDWSQSLDRWYYAGNLHKFLSDVLRYPTRVCHARSDSRHRQIYGWDAI